MKLFLTGLAVFLFLGCNNTADSGNRQATKTHSDSLMDEVVEGHNGGMAKMSKISEAQKAIQRAIDSLVNLPAERQKTLMTYRHQLDSTLNRLKYADYAMNKWMEEFNMDSFQNDEDQRAKYLESEKTKISKVKDVMVTSLNKADSLLKRQ